MARAGWQTKLVERAEEMNLGDARLAVVRAADLILLKLFAGGAQDAWDIEQLLAGDEREKLIAEVEAGLPDLPPDARRLWQRLLRP